MLVSSALGVLTKLLRLAAPVAAGIANRKSLVRTLIAATALAGSTAAVGADDWKWQTDRPVSVCWQSDRPTNVESLEHERARRDAVRKAVEENWVRYSSLRFAGWSDCPPPTKTFDGIRIRIFYGKAHYDEGSPLTPGDYAPGGSYVGKAVILDKQGSTGLAGMELDFDRDLTGVGSTGLHEFGHALGFAHAQYQEGGRDILCEMRHPKKAGEAGDAPVFLAEKGTTDSIMSYCPLFRQMVWTSISESDILGLQRYYGDGGRPLFRQGDNVGKVTMSCPGGTFLHALNGKCYKCQDGFNRTANPDIDAPNACEKPAGESFSAATDRGPGTGLLKTDCARGAFFDIGKRRCYSCDRNTRRTAFPVTSPKACSMPYAAVSGKATAVASTGCPPGSFIDIGKGACYSCGAHYNRTTFAVDHQRACVRNDWTLGREVFRVR